MSVGGGESPRMEPIQSKSMRLIQKVAENGKDFKIALLHFAWNCAF